MSYQFGYDSYSSERTAAEKYAYDYIMHDTWAEVEYNFCEEMEIEPEVWED